MHGKFEARGVAVSAKIDVVGYSGLTAGMSSGVKLRAESCVSRRGRRRRAGDLPDTREAWSDGSSGLKMDRRRKKNEPEETPRRRAKLGEVTKRRDRGQKKYIFFLNEVKRDEIREARSEQREVVAAP